MDIKKLLVTHSLESCEIVSQQSSFVLCYEINTKKCVKISTYIDTKFVFFLLNIFL